MAGPVEMALPPPYLPPRRPVSMPELRKKPKSGTHERPPPFLPPRQASTNQFRWSAESRLLTTSSQGPTPASKKSLSRQTSLQSIPDAELTQPGLAVVERSSSEHRRRLPKWSSRLSSDQPPRDPRLQALRSGMGAIGGSSGPPSRRSSTKRSSTLRNESRLSEDGRTILMIHPSLLPSSRSEPFLRTDQPRPHSHPSARLQRAYSTNAVSPVPAPPEVRDQSDPWKPLALPPPSTAVLRPPLPKPRSSFQRYSSLDNLIIYREEMANWKRESTLLTQRSSHDGDRVSIVKHKVEYPDNPITGDQQPPSMLDEKRDGHPLKGQSKFRNFAMEIGFCLTLAMTQFLAEYLISGFAIALPALTFRDNRIVLGPGTLGLFWPAALLSLSLGATLLIFARLADIYGGYGLFVTGLLWLGTWCLIPGFTPSSIVLDVARAMQGLAIAAFMPSTFVLVSTFYDDGPRKNFVLGLFSGCAPLGFFAGFLTASALPQDQAKWYLWTAAILAFATAIIAYLTIPHDWTDRKQLGLRMDWLGALLITAGLILMTYALAYEPSANMVHNTRSGFAYPAVYGPLTAGVLCLAAAVWVEGWYASCPLLPFDFFKPKGLIAFSLAGLCFYASYGVWLYESATFFQSDSGVTAHATGMHGIELALWYLPTAIGGLLLCIIGGAIMHVVPMKLLLVLSGMAWIAAPLLLGLAPLPLHYWAFVLPSMICATFGIDLTYTISLVYLSGTQPKKYQGLCGAVASILVNLGMSFALPISEIVEDRASESGTCSGRADQAFFDCVADTQNRGYRAMFYYAGTSAGLGLIISVLFVRMKRSPRQEKPVDEERPREIS